MAASFGGGSLLGVIWLADSASQVRSWHRGGNNGALKLEKTSSDTPQRVQSDVALIHGSSLQMHSNELSPPLIDPVRVTGITLTAGVLWSLTRSGGLLTTILMGVPAWRHVDLLPVLANQPEDDATDADKDAELVRRGTDDAHLDHLNNDDSGAAELFELHSSSTTTSHLHG
jgi:hypothetical protein